MKIGLAKISFLAGMGLLLAASSSAFSQGCYNGGYGGYHGGSSYQSYRGGGYGYNSCSPYYSRGYSQDYYGRRCSPQNDSYRGNQLFQPQTSSSATSFSSGNGVEERLSYLESVVTFLLNKLGLLDEFEAFRSGSESVRDLPQGSGSSDRPQESGSTTRA